MDDATQIQKPFAHNFSTRFKSLQGNLTTVNVDLPKIVSEEVNINLAKPIEDHKIMNEKFQIDKFKARGPDSSRAAFF